MQVAVSRLGLPEQDKRISWRCTGKRQLYGDTVEPRYKEIIYITKSSP